MSACLGNREMTERRSPDRHDLKGAPASSTACGRFVPTRADQEIGVPLHRAVPEAGAPIRAVLEAGGPRCRPTGVSCHREHT